MRSSRRRNAGRASAGRASGGTRLAVSGRSTSIKVSSSASANANGEPSRIFSTTSCSMTAAGRSRYGSSGELLPSSARARTSSNKARARASAFSSSVIDRGGSCRALRKPSSLTLIASRRVSSASSGKSSSRSTCQPAKANSLRRTSTSSMAVAIGCSNSSNHCSGNFSSSADMQRPSPQYRRIG